MRTADGVLNCDVCQSPFPADETVQLVHKGVGYELDLCAPHMRKLDKVLAEFLAGARVQSATASEA